jgi:DNA-binding CsgD family transcriptional regulator/tetratricopeptide (TPR) repeat protein
MATRVSASRLIGRAGELAELEAALGEVQGGSPAMVVVAGESGVGKSRLLQSFLARARDAGVRTFGGECIELGRDEIPYAPLIAALRPLVRVKDPALAMISASSREGLAVLTPELAGAEPVDDDDRHRPMEGLLSLLEGMTEETPVVLWLDDTQWADRATRDFLSYLSGSCEDMRLLTVIAYRSEELQRRHPMRALLAQVGRGRRVRRLELEPFDRGDVATQLGDILGSDPDAEIVDRFFERSEGNPLFTEELLAAGRDGRGELPSTLRDALLLRVERLSEPAQGALRLLAAAGRADHRLFLDTCGTDEATLTGGLREAVSAQVIVVHRDSRYGFRHALLGEVIYDDLLPGERADLHLKLARALEARLQASTADAGTGSGIDPQVAVLSEDRAGLAASVAHHFSYAEDQPEALRTAVAAARAAEGVRAPGASTKMLDRALKLWRRVPEPETLAGVSHTTLLTLAARAHTLDADEGHAISLYEAVLGELDAATEPHRVAGTLAGLAGARWSIGQADAARDDLDRALALLPESDPTPERADILELKARFLLLQGRYEEGRDASLEALRAAEATGVEVTEAGVLSRLGMALYFLGEEAEGADRMREAIELARRSGSNDQLATAIVNYADALHHSGESEAAEKLAAEGEAEVAQGDRSGIWIACSRAEILFDLGRWDEAEAVLPNRNNAQGGVTLANLLLQRGRLLLGRGDTVKARARIRQMQASIADSVEPQWIAPVAGLAAELERREGNFGAAREAVDRAIDRIEFCSDDAARMAQICSSGAGVEADAAEAARARGDDEGLSLALARADLMAARTMAAAETMSRGHELAYATAAEAQLARANRAADAPARLGEAAAAWEALARPYPTALARWRQAEALTAAGERAEAGERAGEALAAAQRIGAYWLAKEVSGLIARARLPQDAGAAAANGDGNGAGGEGGAGGTATAPNGAGEMPTDPFGLTPREREVLALLAEGATNREIGKRLFMAEKTASVHVSRILAKLDVRSRTEAAALAYRLDLTA